MIHDSVPPEADSERLLLSASIRWSPKQSRSGPHCQLRPFASRCHASRLIYGLVELLAGDWSEERADLIVVAVCLRPLEDSNVHDAHCVAVAREVEALDEVGRPLEEDLISGC